EASLFFLPNQAFDMGNCASEPKTKEDGSAPEPFIANEEVKDEQPEEKKVEESSEANQEETPNDSDNSLGSLLNQNVEEGGKAQVEKVQEEKEAAKAEAEEEKPKIVEAEAEDKKVEAEDPKKEETQN
ncbi:hypothetical protein MLE29_10770, partial [Pasteurella multocida]|uniref:hypothetical protein n=1 Tax=Pasteurella multocida TaxID=747 RepID=UPI001F115EC3